MSMPPLDDAERMLVEQNTGLVGFVLRRRHTPDNEWDDSFQDGLIGLMRAAQKFDPARGYQFSTYAMAWIRQAVQRGTGLREGVNWRRVYVQRAEGATYEAPLSLDHHTAGHEDEHWTLGDQLYADDDPETIAIGNVDQPALLQRLLHVCADALDVAIVTSALSDDHFSRRAIAEQHGVSHEWVRQRMLRLASKSRHPTARIVRQDAA